jgi:plastocyanin
LGGKSPGRKDLSMRKLIALVVTVGLLGVLLALPTASARETVSVLDNRFSPTRITVSDGESVKFTWRGDNPHNVRGAGFRSSTKTSGTYTKRASRSGTAVCTIHSGMRIRIRVR